MPASFDPDELIQLLSSLESVVSQQQDIKNINRSTSRRLVRLVVAVQNSLGDLSRKLSGIRVPSRVFYFSDPRAIGKAIARELEEVAPEKLESVTPFYGSGVYALYYQGAFRAYHALQGTNVPIYVGSAGPQDSRAETPQEQGLKLYRRIQEHAKKSIARAPNLRLEDFTVRYLPTQSGSEKAAEDNLINRYEPVWNTVCPGIGKHGDIKRTELSIWDVLHPGRGWAGGQTSRKGVTSQTIQRRIEQHFMTLVDQDPDRWRSLLNKNWIRTSLRP